MGIRRRRRSGQLCMSARVIIAVIIEADFASRIDSS